MPQTFRILLLALALLSLSSALRADDYSDCRSDCAAQRDTRNMDCPSPYDTSDSGQQRALCLKQNQDAYNECLAHCPAPPPPPPSSEEQAPPMAY